MTNIQIPCSILKDTQVKTFSEGKESSNLEKVKIIVMHEGVNGNKTEFSIEAIEDAKETIKNIPILAYIKRDDDGKAIDLGEHNVISKIVSTEEGYEIEEYFLERPIGVIPETNNYRVEEIEGLKHVVVDGYLWKNHSNEAYNLIMENGEKGVSMEIQIEEGKKDKKTNIYQIEKYSYLGITVLGDDITPAMGNTCKIETFSLNDKFETELNELNEEVKKYQEEVDNMKEKTQVQEEVVETVEEVSEIEDAVEKDEKETDEVDKEKETTEEAKEQQNYSLSEENIQKEISRVLKERKTITKNSWGEVFEAQEFYLITILPTENIAILENNYSEGSIAYGVPYSLVQDEVVLDFDNKVEYIETWRVKEKGETREIPMEKQEEETKIVNEKISSMQKEIEELKNQLETKDSEIKELKEFKEEKEKETLTQEVNNIIAQFTDIEEEEYKELKEKALNGEISIETLKLNLYAIKGMKQVALEKEQKSNFSLKGEKANEPTKVVIASNIVEPNSKYGSLHNELVRISTR